MGRHGDARMGRKSIESVHLHAVLGNSETACPHSRFDIGYSPSVPMRPLFSSRLLVTPTANGGTVVLVVRHLFRPLWVRWEAVNPVPWW